MTATKKESPDRHDGMAPPVPGNMNEKRGKRSWGPVAAGAVLGVLAVAAVALYLNMGSIAKSMTERLASETLGVRVTLGTMEIRVSEKTVTVSGLNVANPEGFKGGASSLTVDNIAMAAESLSPELLVFKKIDVSGAAVNLEVTERTTNLNTIRNQVNSSAAATPAKTGQKPPPRVIVRELVFNGLKVNPVSTPMGTDLMPVEIPLLRMNGIGERQNGALASAAIAQVLEQITKTVVQSGIQAGYMQGMTPEALSNLKSQMGIVATFREQAKQGLESLKSGIKNLFGGGEAAPAPEPQQP